MGIIPPIMPSPALKELLTDLLPGAAVTSNSGHRMGETQNSACSLM